MIGELEFMLAFLLKNLTGKKSLKMKASLGEL
jgi:hypothetical protein